MTTPSSDPSAAIREALQSPTMDEDQRRDLLTQALIYAEEVRNGYLSEKKRADELEKARDALESIAQELESNLDALRSTDRERRRLLRDLVRAQEEERKRIADDIHDDSIQVMAAVGMRLTSIRKRLSDPDAIELLDRLDAAIEESIRRLRTLLFVLRPISLEREGLSVALGEYVAMNQLEDGPKYEVIDNLAEQPTGELPIIMFRVAQELLTNVRKHAQANNVKLSLETIDGGILLSVTDDGLGFSSEAGAPGHLGIVTARERAEQLGGWLDIQSSPGKGSTVKCWLPTSEAGTEQ